MEQGVLYERYLTRSVTKHIKKQNKNMLTGTGVGHDYTDLRIAADDVTSDMRIITTEGVGIVPEHAWIKAMNNFYVSGGKPLAARITAVLPTTVKESGVKEYMKCFNELAQSEGVQLAGGHTEIFEGVKEAVYTVNITGISGAYMPNKRRICEGCEIVMAGYTAMLGTDMIRDESVLKERFSLSYIRQRAPWDGSYSVKDMVEKILKHDKQCGKEDILYMHDISAGGVYAALWQLGAFADRGMSVAHFSIPIIQETVEFCEFYGINPYMLEGTGGLLFVVPRDKGEEYARLLYEAGINADVIGRMEAGNERMVFLGSFGFEQQEHVEKRCLAPYKGDELYKI